MIAKEIIQAEQGLSLKAKMRDYGQLIKFRLTFTVVFSAAMGFVIASSGTVNLSQLFWLVLGGFLTVGSANGINQIIERNFDKLMLRTANRPIAQNRMGITEAAIFCSILGIAGVGIINFFLNPMSSYLAAASLLSYAFLYTPLKRVSPVAVFVGAFPGAIPPMLGYVAVTGVIDEVALALFTIQFFWQFPHFWAIAWILDEDYQRAGYRLLPSFEGRGKRSARQMVWYTFVLIPLGLTPYWLGVSGIASAVVSVLAAVAFLYYAVKLLKTCSDKDAKVLMFASFLYLPTVLLAYVLDKL
ncbi:MAG: protoheme IX farnesyltransferase [Bacteroidetes bacterium]|nr:MAG: protoheme IX farnesyltransferase [Bacteroidota bacterium]